MRALFSSSLCLLLGLAGASAPAFAANSHVTVVNGSIYTANVSVHHAGKEIGRALVHSNRHVTIGTPIDPTGGSVTIQLTLNGKTLCKLEGTIASATTKWMVTGEPAIPGNMSTAKCSLKRV